ncbi:hypothetical protein MAJ_10119, partial [Metarhizium majus ARSEF 297]
MLSTKRSERLVDVSRKIKTELCEDWLSQRARHWGRTQSGNDLVPSWTATITSKIDGLYHYITCPGLVNGQRCSGCWSRRRRSTLAAGIHCIFGGWIYYDGNTTITDISEDSGVTLCTTKRSLAQLRRLWAKHMLTPTNSGQQQTSESQNFTDIWPQEIIHDVYQMIDTTITRRATKVTGDISKEKTFGQGSGGWSGVSEDGIVLKRDSGMKKVGNCTDRCDEEPGGMFQSGDAEVWMTWNGWSALCTRDGRWSPGYHLEILLLHLTTVIDFGLTRAKFRDREANWARATEWAWVNTPVDIPQDYISAIHADASEMIKRLEKKCAHKTWLRTTMCPITPALSSSDGRDFMIAQLTSLHITRFSSQQQVIDAGAWFLRSLWWSILNSDFDLADVFVGVLAFYAVYWRYNTAKFVTYEAMSIRHARPTKPQEMDDIAEILTTGNAISINESESYGQLYQFAEEEVRVAYDGCTCMGVPEGHEASKLLAAAMDEGVNDELEQRLLVAMVSLNNGANAGDVRCEYGMDLLAYESFVRFFHPDRGLVARLHYRSGNLHKGNTITE